MIEKQMIRLLLNKKFYTQYKGILSPTVFAGDVSSLYETIQKAHKEYDDAVIVEDCPSACAVSNVVTGISIMGTKLKEEHKKHLTPYKNLYICLDRDATTKAYDMAKDLRSSGFDNVIVKPLEDDLKYFNTDEIREMFYDRKTNA